jgi:outer membrane lipoprotein-sorting protein
MNRLFLWGVVATVLLGPARIYGQEKDSSVEAESVRSEESAPAAAPLGVQDVFRLFSQGRDEVRSMQARFAQTTINPDDVIESTGTVVYVNPKRIIFRYEDPPVTFMIDDGHAYEYDEELEQLLVYDIQGHPEAEAFFLGLESNTTQVQEAYSMKLVPAKNPAESAFALEMIPNVKEGDEPIFQKVTLQLAKETFIPTHILIINGEYSEVVFRLEDVVLNAELSRDLSHIFAPENTELEIDDVALGTIEAPGRFFPEAEVTNNSKSETVEKSTPDLSDE